jgi:hypothetical protein
MDTEIRALLQILSSTIDNEAKWKGMRLIIERMLDDYRQLHKAGHAEGYSQARRKLIDLYHEFLVALHSDRLAGRKVQYDTFFQGCIEIVHPSFRGVESGTFNRLVSRLKASQKALGEIRCTLEEASGFSVGSAD